MSVPGAASPLFLATTGAAEFSIARSLRFNSADTAYLNRTPSSASNRKTWTWSGWVKRSKLGVRQFVFEAGSSDTATDRFLIRFQADDTLLVTVGQAANRQTTQVFRDVGSWGSLIVAVNTTLSTANDRIKIYWNGSQITNFSSTTNPSQNADTGVNSAAAHSIGKTHIDNAYYLDAYLGEINLIDGSQLDPTSFGAFDDNGVWQAIDTAGLTFGTNGFRLKFADNSGATATTLGKDTSGNSNNWTPNNLSVAAGAGNDSLVDTPMNAAEPTDSGIGGEIAGNYATLNPLDSNIGSNLTNGNLDAAGTSNWSAGHGRGTIALTSGKWYWEVTKTGGNATAQIGFCNKAFSLTTSYGSLPADSWTFAFGNGTEILRPSGGGGGYFSGGAMANGDIAGIALDMDAGTAVFYKNGTAGATISLSSTKTGSTNNITELFPLVGVYDANVSVNFGQRAFAYTAPSGYKALNTASLSTPTIADGSKYFDIKLYDGNGGSQAITMPNSALSPDWVWIKNRNGGHNHMLFDIVRGAGADLQSNSTATEGAAGSNDLTSFDSNGFSLGSNNAVNQSSRTYVSWAWDGGTGSPVTNNDGSIASQVRAQPSAGFSIVGYNSGSSAGNYSVGHGLNTAPTLIIHKTRSTGNWWVYHASVIDNLAKYLQLNSNAGVATNSANMWGGAFPTNSVFGVRVGDLIGTSQDAIAYCFAPVKGYSAIGSFSPNGTTDNAFVYTGFRTRFILAKFTTPGDWMLLDTSRRPNGPTGGTLIAQDSAAEDGVYSNSQVGFDFLSNGFKVRHNGAPMGDSGKTVIYYAVAENPFQANGGLAR